MSHDDWVHLVSELVGKPFLMGGRGPDAYDCWGLVEAVFERMGRPSPGHWVVDTVHSPEIERIMARELATSGWLRIGEPEPGDMLAMSTQAKFNHVAPVTPFGVLHASQRSGAVCVPVTRLKLLGFQKVEAFRWVG